MKIFRSELDSEFKDRLFDITVGDLPNNSSRFNNDIIHCTLSSTKVQSGFHLTGVLSAEQVYDCDRCLESFSVSGQVRLKLWLISDQDLTTLDEIERVYFPESKDSIELKGIFSELLLLSEPMKKLCVDSCEGLCLQCGVNLNHGNCICEYPDESVEDL
tara:strand:+ start:1022 stop:1498 length:477 start_codon:yes stop_codon:yes gene_type:complete